ncbi:hypothetical protein [Rhizobium ruizarguesonis]|nr:hypothetical protein [Rhizobium ruizarguesonis]
MADEAKIKELKQKKRDLKDRHTKEIEALNKALKDAGASAADVCW